MEEACIFKLHPLLWNRSFRAVSLKNRTRSDIVPYRSVICGKEAGVACNCSVRCGLFVGQAMTA